MKLGILLLLAVGIIAAQAQTSPHAVQLTATSSDVSSSSAGTIVFYRAANTCPTDGSLPANGVALNATALSFTGSVTFTDTTVTAGTWCWYAIGTLGGATGDSNTFQGAVKFAIVLTGSVLR
jgi:hypothetical protein